METSNRHNEVSDKIHGATDAVQEKLEQAAEGIAQKKEQLQEGISAATEAAQNLLKSAGDQLSEYAKTTDQAIRKNPYPALGIALGVGLFCGFLLKRK